MESLWSRVGVLGRKHLAGLLVFCGGHALLAHVIRLLRGLVPDHTGCRLLRIQLSIKITRFHLLLNQRLGLFSWRSRSIAEGRQVVLASSLVQQLLSFACSRVKRCHICCIVALTESTALARARLIRYQLLVGVAIERLLLKVTTATAFLNLPTSAPISLHRCACVVENVVRRPTRLHFWRGCSDSRA